MSTPVRTCSHERHDGTRCGCIALRHRSLCRFHQEQFDRAKRRRAFRERLGTPDEPSLDLPLIEDRASAMLALNEVIQSLALGLIDRATARTYFAGIRIGLSTIKNTALLPAFMEPKPEDDSDSMCQAFLRKLAEHKAANISTDLSPVPEIHASVEKDCDEEVPHVPLASSRVDVGKINAGGISLNAMNDLSLSAQRRHAHRAKALSFCHLEERSDVGSLSMPRISRDFDQRPLCLCF